MSEPNCISVPPQLSNPVSQSGIYLTQSEVAALLRISPRTLERHRLAGTGPAYVKLGRRVVYSRDTIEAWALANTIRSTSEAGGHHG
jgi:predicted DNA-binding transcriptional regulator AlpA